MSIGRKYSVAPYWSEVKNEVAVIEAVSLSFVLKDIERLRECQTYCSVRNNLFNKKNTLTTADLLVEFF